MIAHIVKYRHKDGVKLHIPTLWCNSDYDGCSFVFMDAQHVALAVGGSTQPCKNCIKAIIKELKKGL